jgi:predicted amidohydrolase
VQFGATDSWERNFEKVAKYTTEASDRGADFVCLPEHFAFNDRGEVGSVDVEHDRMVACDIQSEIYLKKYQ